MGLRSACASLLIIALSACGGIAGTPDGAGPDAGDAQVGAAAALEIGTGATSFVPFEDGDTLELVRGCQGAQHVWVALRTWGMDPRSVTLSLALRRDRDGAKVSQTFDVRVSLSEVEGEAYHEVQGLTLVVPEPDQALMEALTLRAEVTERSESGGATVMDERPVRIEWAEDPGGCF